MNLKLLIAGAIVAIIIVCAVAAASTSQDAREHDEPQQAVPPASDNPGQAADNKDTGTPGSPVSTAAAASMPSVSLEGTGQQQTAQSVCSVSGRIIECRGSGLADKPVTLHLMGYNYSGDRVTGTWEVCQLATTTDGEGPDAGKFVFDSVKITPDMQFGYLASYTSFSSGKTIYGYSSNFTLNGDVSTGFIVLVNPDEVEASPF